MGSDVVLVTLMAVAMTLSAFAVFQATRASDEADETLDELRIVQAANARWSSYLGTIVDHDAKAMVLYCQASAERNEAMSSLLRNQPDPSAIIAATLKTSALRPFVLGDRLAQCPVRTDAAQTAGHLYDMERTRQVLLAADSGGRVVGGAGDPGQLAATVRSLGEAERNLMIAGLLLALALAGLIIVEVSGERGSRPAWLRGAMASRSRRIILLLSAAFAVAGMALLLANAVDTAVTYAVLFAIVAVPLVIRWWVRRRPVEEHRHLGGDHPQWWAEAAGAVAVVAFSLAACGLSLVSALERDALAHGDLLQADTQQLQQVAEQEALRDLANMSLMAELDARFSAASTQELTDRERGEAEWDRLRGLDEALNEQARQLEQTAREQSRAARTRECVDTASTQASTPSDLLYSQLSSGEAVLDTAILRWHVLERQRSAIACDVATALTRSSARTWSGHASTYTVALVVLGLAGFMLALAADVDRSARSSRVLLGIGCAGITVGLVLGLLTVPDVVWRAGLPREESVQGTADGIAAAYVAGCAKETSAGLDRSIAAYSQYGPAYERRASARYCQAARYPDWGYLSSDVDPSALPDVIQDLRTAVELGPPSAPTTAFLGWALISDGIARAERLRIAEGLRFTREAIAGFERTGDAHGEWLAMARFNEALGLAAFGNRPGALAAYSKAVRCLAPAAACPGGGLLDPASTDDVLLGALADLELINDGVGVEPYQLAVMAAGAGVPDVDEATLEFSLFDQELQVAGRQSAPVVWYFRPDSGHTWALLSQPSIATLHSDWASPLVPAGQALRAGEYRADVYAGGRRIQLTAGKSAGTTPVTRIVSPSLKLSVAAPAAWSAQTNDGVTWHVGPSEVKGLTLRRVEGVAPMRDTRSYLVAQLKKWLEEQSPGARLPKTLAPDSVWFLGYTNTVVADLPGLRVAAHLEPYGAGRETLCGGTLFLAALAGDASELRVVEEVALEARQQAPTDRPVSLAARRFALELPARWGAKVNEADQADAIAGASCDADASLDAEWEDLDGDLEASVAADLAAYAISRPGFAVESRTPTAIKGAQGAELVVFSWQSDVGTSLTGWQLSAADDDGTRLVVTVRLASDLRPDFEAGVTQLLESVEIT